MTMTFEHLLIISFSILVIITSIEVFFSKKTFLQILKNWCSIDSVHFEDILKTTTSQFRQGKDKVITFTKKNVQRLSNFFLAKARYYRSVIRKKLHPNKETSLPSLFITEIKDTNSLHKK